jgi:hypothetical protein
MPLGKFTRSSVRDRGSCQLPAPLGNWSMNQDASCQYASSPLNAVRLMSHVFISSVFGVAHLSVAELMCVCVCVCVCVYVYVRV